MLDGTPQRRYNLVNRALHDGELLRLRRGRYLLASALARRKPHPFVLAQALRPGSYVSFETALGFHGWIPEATPPILCVAPGRRRLERIDPRFGEFRFYPLALTTGYFLRGVERHILGDQTALVAQTLRALLDRFCLRKQPYPGLAALRQALLKDDSIGRQLDLSFYGGDPHRKLKIKLEIDTHPSQGSDFEYRYLDFPLDFEARAQDLPSNFALKLHALLCRPYVKGRDWFDFGWYVASCAG